MAFRLSVSSPLRTKRSFLSDGFASPPTASSLPPEGLATLHTGELGDFESSPDLGLLEIIAVHGLNGHREKSWIHTNGETGEQTFWLRDLLPLYIPNSRISTFGYVFDGASTAELKDTAIQLLDEICRLEMPKEGQALLTAATKNAYSMLTVHTSLLIFFGTPHRATDQASWERLICNLIYATKQDYQGRLSEGLRKSGGALKEMNQRYLTISRTYTTISFYETEKMPSFGSYIVDRDAASMNVISELVRPLPADHLGMCQIASIGSDGFSLICDSIRNATNPDQKYIECWQTFSALEVKDWPPASFKEVQSPDWLFQHELYRSFVEHPEFGNLELRGQTGSGLSFVASFLPTALRRDIPGAIILQYSFDSRDSRQCSTFSMFASLTCQLLSLTPHCFAYVRHLFNLITDELSWSLENLWAFFRSIALCPAHGTTVVCILDGVNNCDRQHDHFLNDLLLLAGSEFQLKTVTTNNGNPRDDIALPAIDINEQSGLRAGIKEFVNQKLEKLVQNNPSFLAFGERLQLDILQANPCFLTAALTCKMLENVQVRSVPSLLERELIYLPRSLPEIYDRCFLHVEGEAQVWAYDALFWISHAYRPLTVSELGVALAIKYDGSTCLVEENDVPRDLTRDLIHVFRGFVRIQSDDVLLIHESARDFLLDALHVSYPHGKSFELMGHSRIVNFCLDYLLSIDWLGMPPTIFENETLVPLTGGLGLVLYAIEYWHRHYRLSIKVSSLAEKANKLLENKECTKLWSRLQWYQRGKASKKHTFFTDPLTFAAELGLNDIVLSRLELPLCTDADRAAVLHLAALRGDIDFVNQLLSKHFDIKDALHLAAKRGHGDIVKRLIELGADVAARDGTESTALHFASQSGYQSIVVPLIEAKSDVNAVDINLSTSLHLAAEFGHFDVMEALISSGAEVGPRDCEGSTPLHLATRAGQLEAMKLLINNQKDIYAVDNDSKTALHLAAASGLLEPLDLLLSRHVWVDVTDGNRNTALHLAVGAGQLKIVQRLLNEEPDVEIANDTGTPLHLAAQEGHIEIMICLLDAKADPLARNSEERIPLHLAASRGHTRTVQQLIEVQKSFEATGGDKHTNSSDDYGEEGVNSPTQTFIDTKDAGGATPLHLAAASGSQATIHTFIQAGASVNTFDYSGYTPLMRAVRRGDLEGVKLLFNAGAEVDLAILAISPIHVAAEYSHITMIRFLLESGANPEMPDLSENKPLHAAAKAGNIEGVQELLDCGVDVDPFNDDGATPLHLAAAGGHFEVAKMLVEAGHDTNVSDQTSSTPLHAAARVGDLRTLDFLIEKAANIRAMDNKKQLPIHIAAEGGRTEIVERLLQHRSKAYQLKAIDDMGRTSIHIAAGMDFPETVRILLDEGGNLDTTDSDGLTALHLAVQKSHVSTVRLLLEKGASLAGKSSEGSTVLHSAADNGSTEIVQLLLDKGAATHLEALDSNERTPFFLAMYSGNLEIVKCLLDAGETLNASPKWPAMYAAAYYGRVIIVEELLSRGFDKEVWEVCGPNKWTPLHAGYDTPQVIKLLLDAGANINAINSDGKTALHLASYGEYTGAVKILVENNADLNIADQNGSTALHEAVDNAEVVNVLLDKGASVDVPNNEGQTPLFRAASRGSLESFELILKHGAGLWKTDGNGSTPLHTACSDGRLRIVEAILKRNDCTPDLKDNSGCTPLWCAVQNGNKEVVEMLLRRPDVNMNQQNNDGKTLLLMAMETIPQYGVEMMELLLTAGGEIDSGGEQILRLLAGGGHESLVKILLNKNVNPDSTDEHGWTPAMMATATNNPDVLEILPEIKWSPWLPTSFSETDKSDIIMLEDDDMCVTVSAEDGHDCSIRANHPISPLKATFYFEIEILHVDDIFTVAIGLCDGGTALNQFPGWTSSSWAYFSDDGKKYHDAQYDFGYGEKCVVGDRMGCSLDIRAGKLSFYKNGRPCAAEPAFENVHGRLFPIVGMNGSGTKVRINLKDQLRDMSRRLSLTSEGGSSGIQSISRH